MPLLSKMVREKQSLESSVERMTMTREMLGRHLFEWVLLAGKDEKPNSQVAEVV
jgi:hypothetical protein